MTPRAPGASARQAEAVTRAVDVMDRLRSPGGCPWYAAQTHGSLLPYAVEEVHELVEAVESGDRADVRDELGDVLLQVLFHARLAAEDPDDPFDLADVADALTAKLVRRNPHVFARGGGQGRDQQADDEQGDDEQGDEERGHGREELDAAAVDERWERLKRDEKRSRTSALDGVPATLGALARAQKLLTRADRAGLLTAAPPPSATDVPAADVPATDVPATDVRATDAIGEALLSLVAAAHAAGVDAEAALRHATATWEARARRAEA